MKSSSIYSEFPFDRSLFFQKKRIKAPSTRQLSESPRIQAQGIAASRPDTPQARPKNNKAKPEKGIKPELELFDHGMVNLAKYLERHGIIEGRKYFNILLGNLNTAPATIGSIAGAPLGIPGAVGGAVVGDLIQSGVEEYGEGNERTATEYGTSAGLEDRLHRRNHVSHGFHFTRAADLSLATAERQSLR